MVEWWNVRHVVHSYTVGGDGQRLTFRCHASSFALSENTGQKILESRYDN